MVKETKLSNLEINELKLLVVERLFYLSNNPKEKIHRGILKKLEKMCNHEWIQTVFCCSNTSL